MANGHGGARPGAGRTAKADKYEPEITATERYIADRLEELRQNELALATGGAERIEECWELALSVMVEDTRENPSGTVVKIKRQLFPNAAPDEMVLVARKVITPEPDRAAIEYLIDRILGKPTQSVEMSGPHGGDIPLPAHDLSRLTTDELLAMRSILRKTVHDPSSSSGSAPAEPHGGGSGAGTA